MPAIYVVTYHEFNHGHSRPNHPLNRKFLDTRNNYVFYAIDKQIPQPLQSKKVILEHDLDPILHKAGAEHLGEWSFLLAEEKFSFCEYPFFMISSRFYEKNLWLYKDLNEEWDHLFSYFNEYGWGYLPSYDRPVRWIDLSWKKAVEQEAWNYSFFPFTEKTYHLIESMFHVKIPQDYSHTADFFCNYIGFRSRKEFLAYVKFYRPLIDFFFNPDFTAKRNIYDYVRKTGRYRNEKPFTFFLELLCHLFFHQSNERYFALHYDGYYDVDEKAKKLYRIKPFSLPLKTKGKRFLHGQVEKLNTNRSFNFLKHRLKKHKLLYSALKFFAKGLRALSKT